MDKGKNNYFGKRNTGIIFAADLPSAMENYKVLDKIAENVDVIKLSSFLAYAEGKEIISAFKARYNKPVFADFKVADVPHTNKKIVEILRDEGADAIMVHAITGPDSIEDCLEAANGQTGIILQIELTNPGGLIFTAPISEDLASMAKETNVYGVQAPGNRPDKIRIIRDIVGPEKTLVCCGVGAQGGIHKDVMNAGGSYSIVGRAIYTAADPVAALEGIINAG